MVKTDMGKISRMTVSVMTVALLATHQVDASFQREWELFGVPGGIEFFLLFNLVAVGVLLFSLVKLAANQKSGAFWRFIIPTTGLLTTGIHGFFFAAGRTEFSQPVSVAILAILFLSSVSGFVLEVRKGHTHGAPKH